MIDPHPHVIDWSGGAFATRVFTRRRRKLTFAGRRLWYAPWLRRRPPVTVKTRHIHHHGGEYTLSLTPK